jgi:hypothetical protein
MQDEIIVKDFDQSKVDKMVHQFNFQFIKQQSTNS